MSDSRTILHCDCNSFYASVETVLNPSLKQVPMAVCGDVESRHGIILAKNELAKKFQIETAETVWQAQRKCPQLVLVPPHRAEYERYSSIINELYLTKTDLVEPFGIDESWLDVSGSLSLFGTGREIADALRQEVEAKTGLTISVGVSFNKVFAKLGSDYKKPNATTEFTTTNFRQLVWPLPVEQLLYVGDAAVKALHALYIRTIGDLAQANKSQLTSRLGKLGEQIHNYANGLDADAVRCYYDQPDPKSISSGTTFPRNLVHAADLRVGLIALCDEVGARLRRHRLKCHTLSIQIKTPDFKVKNRQKALDLPTNLSKELLEAAWDLLLDNWSAGQPIRMLSVAATQLSPEEDGEQLSFFASSQASRSRQQALEKTMDQIQVKFGKQSVKKGSLLPSFLEKKRDKKL